MVRQHVDVESRGTGRIRLRSNGQLDCQMPTAVSSCSAAAKRPTGSGRPRRRSRQLWRASHRCSPKATLGADAHESVTVPALHVGGWYDDSVQVHTGPLHRDGRRWAAQPASSSARGPTTKDWQILFKASASAVALLRSAMARHRARRSERPTSPVDAQHSRRPRRRSIDVHPGADLRDGSQRVARRDLVAVGAGTRRARVLTDRRPTAIGRAPVQRRVD